MKRKISIVLSALLFAALVLSFSACSGGISADRAKADTASFFDAVKAGNYDAAKTYLHPQRPSDLKTFFEGLETRLSVDFSTVKIISYTNVSTTRYDSDVGGSECELDVSLSVSGVLVDAEIELVKNDSGYGIYKLDFDVED